MIPIPGGFHIDNQRIIPIIKGYLSGMGIEELARFSGLSKRHQHEIVGIANYRKNRRYLSQVTTASILGICDCMCADNTQLAGHIDQLNGEISNSDGIVPLGIDLRKRRAEQIAELPFNCELALTSEVHPNVQLIGRLLCDEVRRVAGKRPGGSKNLQLLGEEGALNMMLPWMAYNVLTRTGQTKVVDDFCFSFCGVLHGTNKLKYQDNLLWYAFIKDRMPENTRHALYSAGHEQQRL